MNRLMVKPIPAEQGDPIDLQPGGAARPGGDAKGDSEPDRGEDAELLAEEEAGGDAERQRREQHRRIEAGEGDAGIGETDDLRAG